MNRLVERLKREALLYPDQPISFLLQKAADEIARLEKPKHRTDTNLLDGLEDLVNHGNCPGVINDDNGHWAVSGSGMQNCVAGDVPQDVQTTFFIEAKDWRGTIREAIDAYLDAADGDDEPEEVPLADQEKSMDSAVFFSSATPEWATPQPFFDELNAEFGFELDPCCTEENKKCAIGYTAKQDGLSQRWAPLRVFMNPPYGRVIGDWMEKAYRESLRGALVVCLVPAHTDAAWWHDYAMKGDIRFIRGRLKFGAHQNSAPFPSAVVIFRPSGLETPTDEVERIGNENLIRSKEYGWDLSAATAEGEHNAK